MKVRAALAVVVLGALAVGAVGVSPGVSASGGTATGSRVETVTGVLERVVVETVDGEQIRYAVRGADRTWWLEGLAEPAPAPGSEVEVTGTPRDEYTLTVATIRVTAAALQQASAAVRGSTRVLVLRAFWGARPPARPTTATTRQKIISASNAWFREVSHRRYSISGSVTPWLRVSNPGDCYGGSGQAGNEALAAAQRAGFNLAGYQRFILYLPCNAGGILGYASLPGQYVVLFNSMDLNVVAHEQGHNLGLGHASSRECRSAKWGAVTWSSRCAVSEYGDELDTMGNRRAGHFNALYKSRLGWLQRSATVTSTRTVTLRPYETTGPGIKAIRLRAGGATYWLEYRTRTGFDREMVRGTAGVQIRYETGDRTQLLDAGPGSTAGYYDFVDAHLPAGSSWTTPQNVRITVTRQTPTAATVAIRFRAGAPRAPRPPTFVRTRALVNAARITWHRPADNGAIIRRYVIRRSDGAKRTVARFAGMPASFTWSGLKSSVSYRFSVRAVNQAGTSAASATSPAVRPLTDKPSIVINSPASGAAVRGIVPIRVTATRNSTTRASIQYVQWCVRTNCTYDSGAPWGPYQWDTRALANGSYTIRATATDSHGRVASASRTVRVSNPTPTVTITSPTVGATVSGPTPVRYSLSPANWNWYSVELLVDGTSWASANPGEPLTFNPSSVGPGQHTLPRPRLQQLRDVPVGRPHRDRPDPGRDDHQPERRGRLCPGRTPVQYSLSPSNWYSVELLVDDSVRPGRAPARRSPSTLPRPVPGSTRCAFRASNEFGTYQSATRTVTVPTPTVTITGPSAGATVSGEVPVTYSLSPTGWEWYYVEVSIDGSAWNSGSPGQPLTINTAWFEAGPHTLGVRASDQYGRAYDSPTVAVTFDVP